MKSVLAVFLVLILLMNSIMISYAQQNVPPPLKQWKSGTLVINIVCKQGLFLMIKIEDHSPACVTIHTSEKLAQYGWGWTQEEFIQITSGKG